MSKMWNKLLVWTIFIRVHLNRLDSLSAIPWYLNISESKRLNIVFYYGWVLQHFVIKPINIVLKIKDKHILKFNKLLFSEFDFLFILICKADRQSR